MATFKVLLQKVLKNQQLTYCVFSCFRERLKIITHCSVYQQCRQLSSNTSQDVKTSHNIQENDEEIYKNKPLTHVAQRINDTKRKKKVDILNKKLHNRDLSELKEEEFMLDVNSLQESDQFGVLESNVDFTRRREIKQTGQTSRKFTTAGKNKKWADKFGSLVEESDEPLSTVSTLQDIRDKDKDFVDDVYEKPHWRLQKSGRYPLSWYSKQIKQFGKEGKIKEAINVLEVWMLERDKVMPNEVCYDSLIGVLGRVGYTKKAFKLYNQMLKRGLKASDHTYTSLFNACGNSPYPGTDGLTRAKNLWQKMKNQEIQPNSITINAMIKAFGRGGDLKTAFYLADRKFKQHKLDSEIYNFLLMSAISNKTQGLHYAIGIWRLMRKSGCKPVLSSYNLLLRSVRECGITDEKSFIELLKSTAATSKTQKNLLSSGITQDDQMLASSSGVHQMNDYVAVPTLEQPQESPLQDVSDSNNNGMTANISVVSKNQKENAGKKLEWWQIAVQKENELKSRNKNDKSVLESSKTLVPLSLSNPEENIPDIFDPKETLSDVISIIDVNLPANRLAMTGGVKRWLIRMNKDGVSPDIKTYGQLMDLTPANNDAEMSLLEIMESNKVKPDIEIFNLMLRRRVGRRDYRSANDVIPMMSKNDVQPNQKTFGILAMTCFNQFRGFQILKEMQDYGLMPDIKMLTALISNSNMKFRYKKKLLIEMELLDIQPNKYLLQTIEKSLVRGRKYLYEEELKHKGQSVKNVKKHKCEIDRFEKEYTEFKSFYLSWLKRNELEQEDHPWASFQIPKDDEH